MLGSYKFLNILHLSIYLDLWSDTGGRRREFGAHLSRNDSSFSCECYLVYIVSHYRMVMNDELEECRWKWFLPILDPYIPTLPYNMSAVEDIPLPHIRFILNVSYESNLVLDAVTIKLNHFC